MSGRWSARSSRTGSWRPGLPTIGASATPTLARKSSGWSMAGRIVFYSAVGPAPGWGYEANVKPLPLVDQKPEGPGNYRTFPEARNRHRHGAKGPGRDVGQGDRYNSSAPRPGKNDQSGRVKTRIAGPP
jgi:hypothetical protein